MTVCVYKFSAKQTFLDCPNYFIDFLLYNEYKITTVVSLNHDNIKTLSSIANFW